MTERREKSPNWKGGETKTSHGYILIRVDGNRSVNSTGYMYKHRYLMEKHLGRKLNKGEIVHHINHNKLDNRIDNLMLCQGNKEHLYNHCKKLGKRKPCQKNYKIKCSSCGGTLLKFDKYGRPRKYHFKCSWRKGKGKKNITKIIKCKCGCGNELNKYDKWGRVRKYISGHNRRNLNE